jgi:hypothetical protein
MGTDDNGWTQLLAALHTAGKNVALDLSASTRNSAGAFDTGVTQIVIPNGMHNIVSIVLPNTTVTTINDGAFQNCTGLMNVTIGNSVTTIGNSAFWGCTSLTSITIGNSVTTIGQMAFALTGLTSIIIPASVTSIGLGAFMNCTSLATATILATTPPTLENVPPELVEFFGDVDLVFTYAVDPPPPPVIIPGLTIRVPATSLNAYRTATNWSNYADIIVAIP